MRFLEEHARAHPGRWFFLYHAMSGVGRYGDLVMEADRVVGELIRTVDRLGMGANALIVFASDNGPEICVREVRPEFGHNAAGTPRGLKRANWGGHRVPFMGRGRGKIPRGAGDRNYAEGARLVGMLQCHQKEGRSDGRA